MSVVKEFLSDALIGYLILFGLILIVSGVYIFFGTHAAIFVFVGIVIAPFMALLGQALKD